MELISKIHKTCIQLNNKQHLTKIMDTEPEQTFPKKTDRDGQ